MEGHVTKESSTQVKLHDDICQFCLQVWTHVVLIKNKIEKNLLNFEEIWLIKIVSICLFFIIITFTFHHFFFEHFKHL